LLFCSFLKTKFFDAKMKYREEIITITVAQVKPRGLVASDGRFFAFPKPLPLVSEIIQHGDVVSFVRFRTPYEIIYACGKDPKATQKCKSHIKQILKIQKGG